MSTVILKDSDKEGQKTILLFLRENTAPLGAQKK